MQQCVKPFKGLIYARQLISMHGAYFWHILYMTLMFERKESFRYIGLALSV